MSLYCKVPTYSSRLAATVQQLSVYTAFYFKLVILIGLVMVTSPTITSAQTCNSLPPSNDITGATDWANITTCLNNTGSATLTAGTYYVNDQITINTPNRSLIGSGRTVTSIVAKFSCPTNAVFEVTGQGGGNGSNAEIRGFALDLTNLSSSCSTAAVHFIRVAGGTVADLTVFGTGPTGPSVTGVSVIKASNILISNNRIRDTSGTGVSVNDSPAAIVTDNTLIRLSVGINVKNNGGEDEGGVNDSSNTRVTNNTIRDITGRAMRLSAAQVNSLPLRNLVVTGNSASGFGITGLYVTSGVQNATIENNSFIGGPSSAYGLWVGSYEPGGGGNIGVQPSYNNQINFNTFQAGSGSCCGSTSYDVSFNGNPNAAGPDQPTISRGSRGNNILGTRGIDPTPTRGFDKCSQYSHAWKNYLNGLNYVPSGGQILLAAAGTYPSSRVTYHIRVPGSSTDVLSFTTIGTTGGNCVLNQENSPPINLAPGLYDVVVDLYDGNARFPDPNYSFGVGIFGWKLSVPLDVR